jgi:hypothetical protein
MQLAAPPEYSRSSALANQTPSPKPIGIQDSCAGKKPKLFSAILAAVLSDLRGEKLFKKTAG